MNTTTEKIKKYKPYPEYKDSGVKWLGKIPEHWKAERLKWLLCKLESGKRETDGEKIFDEVLSIGGEHIGWNGEWILDNPRYISEQYFSQLRSGIISQGDVLLVKDGATIGKVAIAESLVSEKMAVNEHVFILKANAKTHTKYLFYLINSQLGQDQISLQIRGAAQPGLNSDFKNVVLVPLLPLTEQQDIADFLDRRTGEIDELIAKKERVIELLKEKRTAIISHAVTKGLNPDAKMKDSDVDWLGEIPKHWDISSLKRYFRVKSGDMTSALDLLDEGYQVFGGNGFRGFTDKWNTEANTIIIGRYGALCGNVRITRDRIWATEHAFRVFPLLRFHTDYFAYLLYALDLNKFSARTAQPGLNSDLVRNNIVGIPPIHEQEAISDFLDRETSKIDALIAKVTKAIEKLKEYRTALISAAVTGKIDVRREAN
jgi:type I restriction enzyme S subunit